jgi:hypothetical protein
MRMRMRMRQVSSAAQVVDIAELGREGRRGDGDGERARREIL